MRIVKNYADFVQALLEAGFSMGGGNANGVYAVINWDWQETPPYDTPVRWHTDDPETDPWQWRLRVLDERSDIAYAKVFFGKSGYITRQWYPYFLAARRDGRTLEEAYQSGEISHAARRLYQTVQAEGAMPAHTLKRAAGFGKDSKSAFDRALVELQMKLYLTMCGAAQKMSQKGAFYGWSSMVFSTAERFWDPEVFDRAAALTRREAAEAIARQARALNPNVEEKTLTRFIFG